MKSDRELLEAAAKAARAAGLRIVKSDAGPQILERIDRDGGEHYRVWVPHLDDGDALRLAVKLKMDFTLSGRHAAVAQAGTHWAQEYCNGNPCAATRRAIVRAAAAVGEGLVPFPTAAQIHEFGGTEPAAAIGGGME
jgi:hypothetical protein